MFGDIFYTISPLSFCYWVHQSGILSVIRNPLQINGSLSFQQAGFECRSLWGCSDLSGWKAQHWNAIQTKFLLPHIPIYRNIRASTYFSTLKGICCKNKAYQSLSTSQSAFCGDAKPSWAAATWIKPNGGRQRLIKRTYNQSVISRLKNKLVRINLLKESSAKLIRSVLQGHNGSLLPQKT